MVGLTLTPEQIGRAPPEVRRWLESEVAATLGQESREGEPAAAAEHLVACDPNEAMSIYVGIEGLVPIVNVFFELGGEGESSGRDGIEVHRLVDILHHTRLPSLGHLAACLQVIDDAFRRIRGDDRATLYTLDDRGACFIAAQTQQSIKAVWQQLVAGSASPLDSPFASRRMTGSAQVLPQRRPWPHRLSPAFSTSSLRLASTR